MNAFQARQLLLVALFGWMITHDLRTLLSQRVFGIALGYEDLNDHETLRDDPLLALFAEQRPGSDIPLGSPATLCRFEPAVTRQSMARMAAVSLAVSVISTHPPAARHRYGLGYNVRGGIIEGGSS